MYFDKVKNIKDAMLIRYVVAIAALKALAVHSMLLSYNILLILIQKYCQFHIM